MAKIYLWDYKSYADVPEKYRNHELLYVDDMDDGPTLVLCGWCGEEIKLYKNTNKCPKCGEDLIFGRYDW